jgi:hypothetical protein
MFADTQASEQRILTEILPKNTLKNNLNTQFVEKQDPLRNIEQSSLQKLGVASSINKNPDLNRIVSFGDIKNKIPLDD